MTRCICALVIFLAVIGSYHAAAVEGPTPNVTYGVELDGCPAPPRDQQEAPRGTG